MFIYVYPLGSYNGGMRPYAYFFLVLILCIFVGLLHFLSVEIALYWTFFGFDKVMHFLGGFVAAGFGLSFFFLYLKRASEDKRLFSICTTAILSSLLVGVLWEIAELGVIDTHAVYYFRVFGWWSLSDTIGDLIFDGLGGLFSAGVFLYARPDQIEDTPY